MTRWQRAAEQRATGRSIALSGRDILCERKDFPQCHTRVQRFANTDAVLSLKISHNGLKLHCVRHIGFWVRRPINIDKSIGRRKLQRCVRLEEKSLRKERQVSTDVVA